MGLGRSRALAHPKPVNRQLEGCLRGIALGPNWTGHILFEAAAPFGSVQKSQGVPEEAHLGGGA